MRELILPALGVLLVAFSDDVLTARAFERDGEVIDANAELLALGVSNAGTGLLHGFPISSSGSRTAIGLAAGAHTQAYSLTALASILGVLLFARPVLASFPEAALGAIVVYAAVRLNTEANVEVDFTALEALEAVRAELSRRGTIFALARVKQDLLDDLEAFGLAGKIGAQHIFPTLPTAVAAYRQWASQHPPPGPDSMT